MLYLTTTRRRLQEESGGWTEECDTIGLEVHGLDGHSVRTITVRVYDYDVYMACTSYSNIERIGVTLMYLVVYLLSG